MKDKTTAMANLISELNANEVVADQIAINGLEFIRTCAACPEQYEVFDADEHHVGYVRLRWGNLTCECPDCGGELVYETYIDDGLQGCFSDDAERQVCLEEIANAILRYIDQINRDNLQQVKCICDFVEDAITYWCKGKYYDVVGRDDDIGGWRIKHEYGEGIVYDEDFDDYFEEINEKNGGGFDEAM